VLRGVAMSLGALVLPGVVITALVTGAAAHLAFGLPWTEAILLGAVLAPTDPAILIPLFLGGRLSRKLAQTVIAESAFNDPTGAVLALAVAGVLLTGDDSVAAPAVDFVTEVGVSAVIGILAGVVPSRRRSRAGARGSGGSRRRSRSSPSSPSPTYRWTRPAARANWARSWPS
jgi:cell volume regulation protein A